jgi:tetracycline 7-halogenase / FADH2 O2-dependent halogenase
VCVRESVMRTVDVIIIGSGFAGSIMAMILRRLGRSVLILEKGKHPRFAIGESSTPLANLLLEELAAKYDLPDLATFSKWGAWQAAHPEIACGLKRGFTFYKHEFGREVDFTDRTQQLLVAASPHDRIADTHWYRPDFDAHMANKARELGADLIEEAKFELTQTDETWSARGESPSGNFDAESKFLIDASGPRGCLFRHFRFDERQHAFPAAGFTHNFPKTEALFAHFKNVQRINTADNDLPFPVDDAAVHHIFDGGWIWILRFNNGITSAGASLTKSLAHEIRASEGAPAWQRLLQRLPTVQAQFANAETVTAFFHQPKVAFRTPQAAGIAFADPASAWAMLPSAAGFVDPLFSTGFVLTLLGISRLATLFERDTLDEDALSDYDTATLSELDQAGELVAAAFRAFDNFPKFTEIARIYFSAAIWSETLRRLGRKPPSFLLADDPDFSDTIRKLRKPNDDPRRHEFIERIDLAGLTDPSRQNWHPALAEDLFSNAWKLQATREELEAMLRRCGF